MWEKICQHRLHFLVLLSLDAQRDDIFASPFESSLSPFESSVGSAKFQGQPGSPALFRAQKQGCAYSVIYHCTRCYGPRANCKDRSTITERTEIRLPNCICCKTLSIASKSCFAIPQVNGTIKLLFLLLLLLFPEFPSWKSWLL